MKRKMEEVEKKEEYSDVSNVNKDDDMKEVLFKIYE
jgi:hypothetical protein